MAIGPAQITKISKDIKAAALPRRINKSENFDFFAAGLGDEGDCLFIRDTTSDVSIRFYSKSYRKFTKINLVNNLISIGEMTLNIRQLHSAFLRNRIHCNIDKL